MFTVYAEKDIFENIVVFNDQAPHWFNIFCNHSEVCLNMTDEELTSEELQGTPIFEFIMANGGRSPVASKDYFDEVYKDTAVIEKKPRAAFFLNYTKEEAEKIQKSFGVIVQSGDSILEDILTGSFKRKLLKSEEIAEGSSLGWKSLLKFKFPPSNALVLSDNYLLPSTERVNGANVDSGKRNVFWLLDVVLPASLSIPYHITIISEDLNKTEVWRKRIAEELNTEIKKLRNYEINVEVVFVKDELLHDRLLLMNYVNSSCEHGFYLFKARDGKTVHIVNKIQINSYFSTLDNSQGETEYELAIKDLGIFKKVCSDLATHINANTAVYRGAILGDCNADKTLKNRLFNDV
ncbi:MAG: hypothetical protein IPP32_16630 [Bacteroidetes bacterium]|nr:hypothetical protein [Bacteroidota bacterium]